jgi:hypothetical protein
MSTLVITAVIQLRGVNPYVPVTIEQVMMLRENWRRAMPVVATITGATEKSWRTNLMPEGDGAFRLYLHGAMRKSAQVDVGDIVTIGLDFDLAYRNGPMHPMPDWFRSELERDPVATVNWDALTPSRQKEVLRYFAALKSETARERNVARAIAALTGSTVRFMGRDWVDGA